jgi:hypothetical protein
VGNALYVDHNVSRANALGLRRRGVDLLTGFLLEFTKAFIARGGLNGGHASRSSS